MKSRIRYNLMGFEMHTTFKEGKDWAKINKQHTIYMVDKVYTDQEKEDAIVRELDKREFSNAEELLTAAAEEYAKIPRDERGFRSSYGEIAYQFCSGVCILCLKNGHTFYDRPLKVTAKDGHTYYYGGCTVVLCGDKVFDPENGYIGMDINEYMLMLKKDNPLLRMDDTLTYGMTTTDTATAVCDELRNNKKLLDTCTVLYDSEGKYVKRRR